MKIKISKAKISDYVQFLEIFKEIELFHRKNIPWKFRKTKNIFTEKRFNDLITNTNTRFFVAKDKSILVGYVLAHKENSSDIPILKKRKWIVVDELAVTESHKKNGTGTLLMNKVENWAKLLKIKELELNVYSFNKPAISFYEKKGYKIYSQKMRKTLS